LRILALAVEAETARDCLAAAAAISTAAPTANIVALHVRVDPRRLVADPEEVAIQTLREPVEGTAVERAQQTRAIFETWASSSGGVAANTEWLELEGSIDDVVASKSQEAELVVIARPRNRDGHDALHSVIFHTQRPLLFVPSQQSSRQHILGRHMAIAWRPSNHTRLAVEKALPWLKMAEQVTVIAVHKTHATASHEKILAFLESQGIQAASRTVASGDKTTGERLIIEANAVGADCLVMGAYRYGSLVEAVFGGVTRHVLTKSNVPALLIH
jgi:nucleotide-binding universal stress UspA family protein